VSNPIETSQAKFPLLGFISPTQLLGSQLKKFAKKVLKQFHDPRFKNMLLHFSCKHCQNGSADLATHKFLY